MISDCIYLDFNASTPLAPEVAEAMQPFLTQHFGNPSSLHWAGVPAKEAVEQRHGFSTHPTRKTIPNYEVHTLLKQFDKLRDFVNVRFS